MSFLNNVSRSQIFNEFTFDEQQKYFSLKKDKVIFNIDTLYYTVYLNEIENNINLMLSQLSIWKSDYNNGNKDITFFDISYIPFHFCHYEHCLRLDNMFDIFISSYLPNKDTPRIVVQLRSIGLWLKGVDYLIDYSIHHLQDFLSCFSIKIDTVKANRIDYAYHSNLIQNTSAYFNDDVLLNQLNTSMRTYQKVGNITDTVEVDYLSLGNRKSNNVFFRTYNKTREVVEKQYKGMFIDVWYDNGLISEYDKFCYSYGYEHGTYNSVHIGRIEWYLQFGKNEDLKKRLYKIRESCFQNSDNYTFIKKALKGLLPDVTNILNCEFQCKSKFFNSFNNIPSNLPDGAFDDVDIILKPLFHVLRSTKVITDYLTSNTVSFKTDNDYTFWWKRIRQCKTFGIFKGTLIRKYSRNLDIEKHKQRVLSSVSSISALRNNLNDNTLTDDISDMLCILNDNDICNIIIDSNTGEQLEFKYRDYDLIKKRKQRQLRPILNNTD